MDTEKNKSLDQEYDARDEKYRKEFEERHAAA
jgi:hypothetical protein